ncbi:MAG TPA: hypothetical protein VJ722_06610, partial [Rhodanobacteraceae bacterium]|nr:hypothetical protein [Rhodanobacteraceae bacterium]
TCAACRKDASRVFFLLKSFPAVIPAQAGIHFALDGKSRWIPVSAAIEPRRPRNDDKVQALRLTADIP